MVHAVFAPHRIPPAIIRRRAQPSLHAFAQPDVFLLYLVAELPIRYSRRSYTDPSIRRVAGIFSERLGWPPYLTFLEFSRLLTRPPLDHHFRFRVELDSVSPLSVQNSEEAFFPSAEREVRHRRRHANIDPDIPRRRFIAKSPRRRAARGEERRLVPVRASRNVFCASPIVTATDTARHRCPAQPKALSLIICVANSISASGSTIT